MPFWTNRVEDAEFGGYFNDFDRFGNRTGDEKAGWFVGRNLYTFSMMYRLFGENPRWLELARAGRVQLDTKFSRGDGRFNQKMTRDGRVINGFTSIFTDHFVVKGLFEYLRAAGLENDPTERALAHRLAQQLFADVRDPSVLKVEHIPDGMRKHAVNFMTLIVALESRPLFENDFKDVLCECVEDSLYRFANDSLSAPLEYISLQGTPVLHGEGRLVDPGHSMESLWFSIHAGAALGRPDWIKRAAQVLTVPTTRNTAVFISMWIFHFRSRRSPSSSLNTTSTAPTGATRSGGCKPRHFMRWPPAHCIWKMSVTGNTSPKWPRT